MILYITFLCGFIFVKIEIYENIHIKYFEILLNKTSLVKFVFLLSDGLDIKHAYIGIVLNVWSLQTTHIRKSLEI
jgi:heme/copper-type cytochrome/quinol oxidase subunit 3